MNIRNDEAGLALLLLLIGIAMTAFTLYAVWRAI